MHDAGQAGIEDTVYSLSQAHGNPRQDGYPGFRDRKIFVALASFVPFIDRRCRISVYAAGIVHSRLAERHIHYRHHGKEKDRNTECDHHPRLFEVAGGIVAAAGEEVNQQPDEAAQDRVEEQPGHHEQQEHGAVHRPAVHGEEGFQIG